MSFDLTSILEGWPYEPGHLNVRLIEGDDGEPRVQIRLDLGVLQMRTEGRPDGQTPDGFATLLEAIAARMDGQMQGPIEGPPHGGVPGTGSGIHPHQSQSEDQPSEPAGASSAARSGEAEPSDPASDADPPDGPPDTIEDDPPHGIGGLHDADEAGPTDPEARLVLDGEACRRLREEAVQFYHRAVALLVIEDFDAVVRDTSHNLRLFDLLRDYGGTPAERESMEGQRPYITMMRARALASLALRNDEPKAAMLAIDEGLEALRSHYESAGEPKLFDNSREADALRSMRDALTPKLPVSQKSELKKRLDDALRAENYELAAILRDELRLMSDV